MPFYLEEELSKLFEKEILFLRRFESSKLELMNRFGWNFRDAFRIITEDRSKFIDKKM